MLTITLKSEIEEALRDLAARRKMTVEELAAELIQTSAVLNARQPKYPQGSPEWLQMLREYTESLTPIPHSVDVSRDAMYEGRE